MVVLKAARNVFLLCLLFISVVFTVSCVYCLSANCCFSGRGLDVVGRVYVQASKTLQAVTTSCSMQESHSYLNRLCKSYHLGQVTGSMCKPLCDSQEISYSTCFPGGKDKRVVVLATWGERKIVLKTTKLSTTLNASIGHYSSLSVKDFWKKTTSYIEEIVGISGNNSINQLILKRVVSECDIGRDGMLTGLELEYCAKLVQPDVILSTLLKDSRLVPQVHGTCGELVAVEYASTEPLRASILDRRPWTKRVELAIAVLDMIQELERTLYGTLYLCDMQWKNLGVVRQPNEGIIIKSIDNDKSFFDAVVEKKVNQYRPCLVDHDCRLVGCSVECNQTTHTCSHQLSSNNLQMVCKFIFWNNINHLLPALLTNPPTSTSSRIKSLMTRCLHSGKSHQHIPQELIDQFYLTLWQSLSKR